MRNVPQSMPWMTLPTASSAADIPMEEEVLRRLQGAAPVRLRRDMPAIHAQGSLGGGKKKKLRTCADMNGILGGQNAFNFVSFIVAILTLIVNVNNRINNNNNNLNGNSINTGDSNNANANVNSLNGNIVNVMPPGRKRRDASSNSNSTEEFIRPTLDCAEANAFAAHAVGDAALATARLMQGYLSYVDTPCGARGMCQALQDVEDLGNVGRIIASAARTGSDYFLANGRGDPAGGRFSREACHREQEEERQSRQIQEKQDSCSSSSSSSAKSSSWLRCSRCMHPVVDVSNASFVDPARLGHAHPDDVSARHDDVTMQLFGGDSEDVHVLELVNPGGFRFRAVHLDRADVVDNGKDDWNHEDPWFKGYSWKVAYCPVCGQPMGWIWRRNNESASSGNTDLESFYGLRLDRIVQIETNFIGPLLQIPDMAPAVAKMASLLG